jgi:hypothetical protein
MGVNLRAIPAVATAGLIFTLGLPMSGRGEEPSPKAAGLHDSFETPQTAWEREHTDTTINLIEQARSDRAAYDGKQSERFQFEAGPGSQFFVSYALPKVPVSEDLQASVHVRANRVGVQLFARVVLPEDLDPETRSPSFVLIPGTVYDRVDRWQRLELSHLIPSIERQARVLRVSTRRPVSLKGAYLERLVVNLMGAPGASEVFLDSLSVAPVPVGLLDAWNAPQVGKGQETGPAAGPGRQGAKAAASPPARLDDNFLRRLAEPRKLRDWFPVAIDAPGADVTELRRYGFDVLVDDRKSDPKRIRTAIDKGFLLMPRLSPVGAKADPGTLAEEIAAYPFKDSVAFWDIGEGLGRRRELKTREQELNATRKLVSTMRQLPGGISRITTARVDGDLPFYSRPPSNVEMMGIQPLLWASGQELRESLEFMRQRRRLTTQTNPKGFFWAWLPAAASPIVRANIWGEDAPPAWGVPQVLPEQLRLMTYMALSAGYRGLGYRADADLTRPAGRALLIEMAFLNEELDLLESVLARSEDPHPTYLLYDPPPADLPPPGTPPGTRIRAQKEIPPKPDYVASAISVERKGALLLVGNYTAGAQYQPPQMAARNLILRAMMPESAQAFQISPGEVKVLQRVRAPGGTELLIEEFDTTAMILCTTDLALKDRLESAIIRFRHLAAQLAIEQAELMLQAAADLNGRLNADGQHLITADELKRRSDAGVVGRPTDERDLLARSEASIKAAREAQEREDFALAWAEARRASRPLRILMHGHWTKAYTALVTAATTSFKDPSIPATKPQIPLLLKPISAPPCVSFFTLPELYFWVDWIGGKTGYKFGPNRVPSGSFDDPKAMAEAGWVNLDYQLEGVDARLSTVPREDGATGRMIRMSVTSTNPEELDKKAPFLDFPIAAVRSPAVKVEAKNLIRISVLVKRPIASNPGVGGIIVRDSIGGEQFQYRTADPIPAFSRVVLYRKAPQDGNVTVTLGLAGYGEAEFDDLRVELVEADEAPEVRDRSDLAATPSGRSPRQPAAPDTTLPAATTGRPGPAVRRR